MRLEQYIKENGYTQEEFSKKIGITLQHLSSIITFARSLGQKGKKAGPKIVKIVDKITKGAVGPSDLLTKQGPRNQPKQNRMSTQNNPKRPPENYVCAASLTQIPVDFKHEKPLELKVLINGHVLFTKVLHGYIEDAKDGYNYRDDDLKLKFRVKPDHIDKSNEILEQGIPPVTSDIQSQR